MDNSGARGRTAPWIIMLTLAVQTALPAAAASATEDLLPDPQLARRLAESLKIRASDFTTSHHVPTVGCAANGQQGPLPAADLPPTIGAWLTAQDAARLAYYKAGPSGGVLAPRGWKCFARYGSDGDILLVAPPNAPPGLFTHSPGRTSGPAVILTQSEGSTSGRFEVARIAARLFPAAKKFVDGVRSEELTDPNSYVSKPFPADTNMRLSPKVVAFRTPPGATGAGSTRELDDGTAISGIAALIGPLDGPSLRMLRARLPQADAALLAAIAINALPSADEEHPGGEGEVATAAAHTRANWQTYTNARFQCRAAYPAVTFSRPQPENGDGRTLQSNDGATLKIFGANNALAQTAAELEGAQTGSGGKIVYRAHGLHFFVTSGYRGNNIFYLRSVLSADKQTICSVDLEYPEALRSTYDGLTGAIGSTLAAP